MWNYSMLLLLLCAALATCKHEMYKGNQVWGFYVSDRSQADLFHEYEMKWELDVWTHPAPGHSNGSVMLEPGQLRQWRRAMDEAGIRHWSEVPDVMQYLEEFDARRARSAALRTNRLLPFVDFPRYAEIDEYLEQVAADRPDIVQIVTAGPSSEGRPIKYLKISTTNFEDTSKPVVFIDAMIHAREWVTTPVTLMGIQSLAMNMIEEDSDLLEDMDWIIMPLVNPDGYEYSHTDERLWRRTRSVTTGEGCLGVDGNRNFDYNFATIGVSTNPCSQTYPGAHPYSEPETGYVRDILHEHLPRIKLYIAIHSQGNMVLFAYGDGSLPGNAIQLHHMGAAMGAAMDKYKLPEAGFYRPANSALLLYETSGTASDYAQFIGVPFAYTYELPGYGFGHDVPTQYMEQVAMETWEGIKVGARLAVDYHRAESSL